MIDLNHLFYKYQLTTNKNVRILDKVNLINILKGRKSLKN